MIEARQGQRQVSNIQGDDGLIEVSIERDLTVPIELHAGQSH